MNVRTNLRRVFFAALVTLAALLMRVQAAQQLPPEYDEIVYLRRAQLYADGIRSGNWAALLEDDTPENPPLAKLIFGAALATQAQEPPLDPEPGASLSPALLLPARLTSVLFSAFGVFVATLLSPPAGVALALHSLHVRYASVAMLEALPFAASLLCAFAYRRSGGRWNAWLALSGIALGVTAASKYLYCVVGLAVLAEHALSGGREAWRRRLRDAAAWGLLALATFFALDPFLWPDPLGRLASSLSFHATNSALAVNNTKYVAWQPLLWLATPATQRIGMLPAFDALVLCAAVLGLPALWQRGRSFVVWLGLGAAFLFVYSNKWPQYPLAIVAPLCLSAGAAVEAGAALLRRGRRGEMLRALRRRAAFVAAAAATAAGCALLGGVWHAGDPAFRAALADAQQRMRADEALLFVPANPYVEPAVRRPDAWGWDWSGARALSANQSMLDFHTANRWLGAAAEGRGGVWLLTHQALAGDPSDALRTLLQRQANRLSPAWTQTYSRTYELTYFRFDAPYAAITGTAAFDGATVDVGYGRAAGLSSGGCAQLRPTRVGGLLEASCLWRIQPHHAPGWDTQVSLRLFDAEGRQVLQSDQRIARSGLPTVRFDGALFGNYFVPLPADLPAGRYELRLFPYGGDGEYAPLVRTVVEIGK
jgi:hypothetical protein